MEFAEQVKGLLSFSVIQMQDSMQKKRGVSSVERFLGLFFWSSPRKSSLTELVGNQKEGFGFRHLRFSRKKSRRNIGDRQGDRMEKGPKDQIFYAGDAVAYVRADGIPIAPA
jgi:hypothetical protein